MLCVAFCLDQILYGAFLNPHISEYTSANMGAFKAKTQSTEKYVPLYRHMAMLELLCHRTQ